MKRELVWYKSFVRAFKKVIKRDPRLEEKIYSTLQQLIDNPFHPSLDTHKLHGRLRGYWACSVEYDYRLVFSIERESSTCELIMLFDIGTHDEV
ncbi:MAG: type II toxin-antitoxin system mRNA interferase toxin, RelE/StbE family, partial [Bacteroidota bacterium]